MNTKRIAWINSVVNLLFKPEISVVNNILQEIYNDCTKEKGTPNFVYRGKEYTAEIFQKDGGREVCRLAPDCRLCYGIERDTRPPEPGGEKYNRCYGQRVCTVAYHCGGQTVALLLRPISQRDRLSAGL